VTIGFAQNGIISGYVKDSINGLPLSHENIYLLENEKGRSDTVRISKDGFFKFGNVPIGQYSIVIPFPTYRIKIKSITISSYNSVVNCGKIELSRFTNKLDTVIVRGTIPRINFKKDTVEYIADSFKVPPNANTAELLLHLPGVSVRDDNKIIINGQEITQVLVNGQPFFWGNPALAISNLPANIISKVQVYSSANDHLRISPNSLNKTKHRVINLKLKKEANGGTFGQMGASGGVRKIYGFGGSLNNFKERRQLALVAQSTNSLNPLFSSFIPIQTNKNGITKYTGLGLNFSNIYGKNTRIALNYIFQHNSSINIQDVSNRNLYPDDSSNLRSIMNTSNRESNSHVFKFDITSKIGKNTDLQIQSNFTTNTVKNSAIAHGLLIEEGLHKDTLYKTRNNNNSFSQNTDVANRFSLTHRFNQGFLTIKLGVRNGQNKSSTRNISINHFGTSELELDTINQSQNINKTDNDLSTQINYSLPITKNQLFTISYNYHYNSVYRNLNVFKYDRDLEKYSAIDSAQSNKSNSILNNNEFLIEYQLTKDKYLLAISSGIEIQNQKLSNQSENSISEQNYLNLVPSINLNYFLSNSKSMQVAYNFNTQTPDLLQLQKVINTSDSLVIYEGNPNLKEINIHNFQIGYTSDNAPKHSSFSTMVTGTIKMNDIQYSTRNIQNGAQITKPINVNGSYNIMGNINYNFFLQPLKSTLQFNSTLSYGSNKAILNEQSINTNNYAFVEMIGLSSVAVKHLFYNLHISSRYNRVSYISTTLLHDSYWENGFSGDIKYFPSSRLYLSSHINITYNDNKLIPQEDQLLPIISPEIGLYLLKNKQIQAKLSVYDVLNKGINASIDIYQNSVQTIRSNSRGRYIMFSLIYNFRRFAKLPGRL